MLSTSHLAPSSRAWSFPAYDTIKKNTGSPDFFAQPADDSITYGFRVRRDPLSSGDLTCSRLYPAIVDPPQQRVGVRSVFTAHQFRPNRDQHQARLYRRFWLRGDLCWPLCACALLGTNADLTQWRPALAGPGHAEEFVSTKAICIPLHKRAFARQIKIKGH